MISLEEEALGPEHPDTLSTCYALALCLQEEFKFSEARDFAKRAADGGAKVLGAKHPDRLKYEKFWQSLQTTNAP